MKQDVLKQAAEYSQEHRRRRRRHRVLSALAMVMVFCTVYTLIMPALTLEGRGAPLCGIEEHVHTDECYGGMELTCGLEEVSEEEAANGHVHTDECYELVPAQPCELPEGEGHTHTDECYETRIVTVGHELICEQWDDPEHVHTDECFTPAEDREEKILVCGQDEYEPHTHTAECLEPEAEKVLVCELEEVGPVHTHTEECYTPILICGKAEHTHTEECWVEEFENEDTPTGEDPYTELERTVDSMGYRAVFHAVYFGELAEGDELELTAVTTEASEMESDRDYEYAAAIGERTTLPGGRTEFALMLNGEPVDRAQYEVMVEIIPSRYMVAGLYQTAASTLETLDLPDTMDLTDEDYENEPAMDEAEPVESAEPVVDAEPVESAEPVVDEAEPVVDETEPVVEETEPVESAEPVMDEAEPEPVVDETEAEPEEHTHSHTFVGFMAYELEEGELAIRGSMEVDLSALEDMDAYMAEAFDEEGNPVYDETYAFNIQPLEQDFMLVAEVQQTISDTLEDVVNGVHTDISKYLTDEANDAANKWQIVENGYKTDGTNNKTGNDRVRLQKSVIPTDVENEFLVYLSIDSSALYEQFFQYAEFWATTSNKPEKLGATVNKIVGNPFELSTTGNGNYAYFNIVNTKGEVLAEKVKLYWDSAENVSVYFKLSNGQYMFLGNEIRSGNENNVYTIIMPNDAVNTIWKEVLKRVDMGTVTDTMGEYIEFVNVVGGDYRTTPETKCVDGVLTWYPAPNQAAKQNEIVDEKTKTVWFENLAQLVYKVRLNVTKPGFNSCDPAVDAANDTTHRYEVNQSAILSYNDRGTEKEATFPVPYVRGLLYDVHFKKVDPDGKVLAGAEFKLTDGTNEYTATSGTDGEVNFSGVQVPWGTYTLTETKAPEGYLLNSGFRQEIRLCYTDRFKVAEGDETYEAVWNSLDADADHNRYVWTGTVGTENKVVNDWATYDIIVEKVTPDTSTATTAPEAVEVESIEDNEIPQSATVAGWSALSGAEFSLYAQTENEEGKPDWELVGTEGGIVPSTVGNGDVAKAEQKGLSLNTLYKLVETKAPAGYNQLTAPIYFMASSDAPKQIILCDENKTPIPNNGNANASANALTLVVANYGGFVLPSTGGTGTYVYALGGALLMAAAVILMYMSRKRAGGCAA